MNSVSPVLELQEVTAGYGPFRAVLMGSVSHAVIRKAHCPVVVVPRGTDNAISDLAVQHEATTG